MTMVVIPQYVGPASSSVFTDVMRFAASTNTSFGLKPSYTEGGVAKWGVTIRPAPVGQTF